MRGRLGYAAGRFMPFVTGGAAFGDIRASTPGLGGGNTTNAGWTVGAGIEFALVGNWTAKAEYLCGVGCGAPVDNVSFTANIARRHQLSVLISSRAAFNGESPGFSPGLFISRSDRGCGLAEAEVAIAKCAGERDLADVRDRGAKHRRRRAFANREPARHLARLMLEPLRLVLLAARPS